MKLYNQSLLKYLMLFGISAMLFIVACGKDDDEPTPTPVVNADISGVYDGTDTWQTVISGVTDNGADPSTMTITGSGTSFSISDGSSTTSVIVSGNNFSGTQASAFGETYNGTLKGSLSGNNLTFDYNWDIGIGTATGTFVGTRPDPGNGGGASGTLTVDGVSYPFVNNECRANNLVIYAAYEVDAAFGNTLSGEVKGVTLHFPTTESPAAGNYTIVTYQSVDFNASFTGNIVVANYIDAQSEEATSGTVTVTIIDGVPNFKFSSVVFNGVTVSATNYPCTY